eukprot:375178-Lingulodinium_polyedra.AAC.1
MNWPAQQQTTHKSRRARARHKPRAPFPGSWANTRGTARRAASTTGKGPHKIRANPGRSGGKAASKTPRLANGSGTSLW